MALLAILQAPAQGVNWLSVFAQNLTNLTTQNGGVLTSVGMSLLSFVAFMMLVQMVISINTANWTISFRPQSVDAGTVMRFLLRLGFCALLEHYWVNPFPGASFGFNHLFSYLAEALAQALDQTSLNTLTSLLREASTKMDTPSLTAPLELLCYVIVQLFLGISSGILFLINISSFILYGVSALFGPVFIPLYLTNSFRSKFFQYIDVLIGFAMIRAVAAAFLFVWAGFMTTFIQQTFNGDYSVQMWLAKMSQFVIGALSVALLGSLATIVSLSKKPLVNRYVRIDEMGRAQAADYKPGDVIQYGKGSPKHGLLPKTEATVEAVDSRRNLIVVRTGQDDLVTYSPSRLKTATNDAKVYRPELQPISQGERIRITRNDKELNVRAGDFATVTRTDDKDGLKVRLDSGKEIELTAKQARYVEHGYAVESGRRVAADRFIITGDTAEAMTLKRVPAHARDLSIHTTAPAVQQHKAPERGKTPQHEQAQKPPQREIQRGQGIGLSL